MDKHLKSFTKAYWYEVHQAWCRGQHEPFYGDDFGVC